ncbi:MAG: hypothetical protein M5U34_12940 [Chloroflexi bacterium]|nr:hypothetical protein [Chloroflexota bacterium]
MENITTLPLHLEKLYVQTEPCQEDAVAEICLGWQQTFPPVSPTTVITATAAALLPSAEGFLLQEPVNGFIAVQLRKDGQIMDSAGQTLSADVVPGTEIEATGLPGLAGILEAEKIVVLDK